MYELFILGMLMGQPLHGYLIAKIINDIIGPFAKASTGRIYPLLNQFEQDGLVTSFEQEHEGRTQRVFQITDQGRKRFHQLMMDTTSNPKGYQELFSYKVALLEHLEPEERLHLLDHYITYCHAHVLHLSRQVDEFLQYGEAESWTPAGREAFLSMMRHRAEMWEREMEWARSLRAQVAEGEGGRNQRTQ